MNKTNEYLMDLVEPEIDRLEEQCIREHEKELANSWKVRKGDKS